MNKALHWPIAKEGLPFLVPSALLAMLFACLGWNWLTFIGILFTLFVAFFFRNPQRKIPALENVIVSPADGKIIQIEECEEERFLKKRALKIGIFMSVFDVHLNRAPVSGRVLERHYLPGRFLLANAEKSSRLNEQNALTLQADDRTQVLLVQIAGFVARRIVCYAKPDDLLTKGEIIGMIHFGSRVDLYLPVEVKPLVRVGQHVRGGESILGYRE